MNDTSRHREAIELCDAALALPAKQRQDFLRSRCGDDAQLRGMVERLLGAVDEADGFLEPTDAAAFAPGQMVGPYTLVDRLGEGGMGTVYLAESRRPEYTQRVAVKIARGRLAGREVLERFHEERRILARLNHPYIAGLLDAGTTDDGAPYLVMEYVEGLPIDEYCDRNRLGIRARLALLIKVMMAVQAAHQSLVIHRDLKPSNVLVTADGLPKLVDFGIAKLYAAGDDGHSELTRVWGQVMTPAYASPEHILEGHVTTASDVYALGILTCQLLAGELPYEIDARTQHDVIRQLESGAVPRPSARLATAANAATLQRHAERRGVSPHRLIGSLTGDLDNIVLKALRFEPGRRYDSAAQMAEDLKRHLDGRPVIARPDTLGYRAGKFLRRYWLPTGALTAFVVALIAGAVSFAWQAERARAERDRTQLVNEFLQSILIEADPYEAGADATIRDVLVRADEMIAERFATSPDLEAALRRTVGYTQLGLMELDAAALNLGRAHELNLRLYGAQDQRAIQTAADLAWTAFRRGNYDAAQSGYEAALALLDPGRHELGFRIKVLNDFGVVLIDLGELERAVDLFEQVRVLMAQTDASAEEEATLLNNLAIAYHDLGELDAAETAYRQSIAIGRARSGPDTDPNLAIHLSNFALLMRQLDRDEEALELFREALQMREHILGPRHGFTGLAHMQVGRVLLEFGELNQARPHIELGLEISAQSLTDESPQLLLARALAARLLHADGDAATAAAKLGAVADRLAAAGAGHQGLWREVDAWRVDAAADAAR